MVQKERKRALVLSGGGGRGAYHVGVLRFLEEHEPRNLLHAAGMAFEWALLASFQANLKLFRRVNELVRFQVENARLRAASALLMSQLRGETNEELGWRDDADGVPDVLEKDYQRVPEPIIVAPRRPIPVDQIVRYTESGHQSVYEMGYDDARRAWRESGRPVEGEG